MKKYMLIITVLSDAQLNRETEMFPEIHISRFEEPGEMIEEISLHKENLGKRLHIDFCGKIDYEINTNDL